jgi:hypothetical protein
VVSTESVARLTIASTGAATFSGVLKSIASGAYAGGNEQIGAGIVSSAALATVQAVARFSNYGNGYVTKIILSDNSIADAVISFEPSGTATSSLLGFGSGTAKQLTIDGNGKVTLTGALSGTSATFSGAVSKGSGSFRIEHPLPSLSETHQLVHSFIEGPKADLIYRGKLTLVNGKAQANIDEVSTMTEGTFEALCREVQCFTTNESGWNLVKGKVIGNIIYIESQNENSTDEISWLVIGERKDKHMMETDWTDENGKVIVEPLKPIEQEPMEDLTEVEPIEPSNNLE